MYGGPSTISVIIADDHPVYREGLGQAIALDDDMTTVGVAGDGATALEAIRSLRPTVAVVDLQLPDMDGIAVVTEALAEGLTTRFVIVSAFDDSMTVYRALEAGAMAYLPKSTPTADLCDAVRLVARGQTVLPLAIQTSLATEIRRRQHSQTPVLTPREIEVLSLTAEGMSAVQISERLFVSATTVKSHLQHVYVKLDVNDRAAAVARAHKLGLLS